MNMENLEFESINNFKIAIQSEESVTKPLTPANTSTSYKNNTVNSNYNSTSYSNTYNNKNTTNSGYNTSYNSTRNTSSSSKTSVDDIIAPINTTEETLTVEDGDTWHHGGQSATTSVMWIGTVLISFVIWITCVISLILNCVRKNVGKAVFSGIGLVIPILSIFISTIGKTFVELEDGMEGIGMFLAILAIVIEVVVEIIAFIFCFSKNKNKTPNE